MNDFENTSTASASINTSENRSDLIELSLKKQHSIERQPQIGFDPERLIPAQTYVEVGVKKLTALCHALGMSAKITEIIEIFRAMTISWSERQIGDSSGWQSDLSDDGSPFEFSIALDPDKVELRVLVEAQGQDANLQSNWQAGLELNQYLAAHHNVSLDRFEQIADLFVPMNADAKFSMWHSACFYPDKPSAFKLYLNPQSQHKSRSAAIIEESLVRLGFTHAWPTLAQTAAQRGPDKDQFVYFSLDLADSNHARVKVYLRHHDATPAELESALSAASNYVSGDAIEFCQAMAPDLSSFSAKSMTTCFAWIEGDNATPSSGTLQLPISNYALNDRVVCDRLDLYLVEHSLPFSMYHSAIQSFASHDLAAGIGMHSYISLRTEQQQRRVTAYLNPQIDPVKSPQKTQSPLSTSSLEEMVWHYEEYSVADHPFLQRLQREPVNKQHIWLLFTNIHEAVVPHFTRWLATTIGKINDDRILCFLAKQLNDELGNGDIDGIHKKLFQQMMSALDSWKMESFTEEMLNPGREINKCLEGIFLDPDPYMGVGAVILLEIIAKQFDLCLGREFRKTDIDLSTVSWLILHEVLELDHADESLLMARFATDSAAGALAAKRSVEKTRVASWKFLDGIYRLCYGSSSVTI
jgi:DMATS type aromatic prenyltransferase